MTHNLLFLTIYQNDDDSNFSFNLRQINKPRRCTCTKVQLCDLLSRVDTIDARLYQNAACDKKWVKFKNFDWDVIQQSASLVSCRYSLKSRKMPCDPLDQVNHHSSSQISSENHQKNAMRSTCARINHRSSSSRLNSDPRSMIHSSKIR